MPSHYIKAKRARRARWNDRSADVCLLIRGLLLRHLVCQQYLLRQGLKDFYEDLVGSSLHDDIMC